MGAALAEQLTRTRISELGRLGAAFLFAAVDLENRSLGRISRQAFTKRLRRRDGGAGRITGKPEGEMLGAWASKVSVKLATIRKSFSDKPLSKEVTQPEKGFVS
jgi:hypothetical protein